MAQYVNTMLTTRCCDLMHKLMLYSLHNKSDCRPLCSLQAHAHEALCLVILVVLHSECQGGTSKSNAHGIRLCYD